MHRDRIVDHQSPALQPFEDMRAGDIAEIERRILPHQHYVDLAPKIEQPIVAALEMLAGNALHHDRGRPAGDRLAMFPRRGERQRAHVVVPQLMPPRLGRQHQVEARIAVDVDRFQRVHLDRHAQRHQFVPVGVSVARR